MVRSLRFRDRTRKSLTERPHLGSGKSTLLAIILGDHPRSFTEMVSLFGKPRDRQATATRELARTATGPEAPD